MDYKVQHPFHTLTTYSCYTAIESLEQVIYEGKRRYRYAAG